MSNTQPTSSNVKFGGPDLKQNALRDILLQSIENTPADGTISWMCYYLHDQKIIEALINAAARGATISIFIDSNPRIPEINYSSIEYLHTHSQNRIKIISAHKKPVWEYFGLNWHPHFHGKLYFFSHPTAHAFIGSYNPTAGAEELPKNLLMEIGDHSISHNVLVKIDDQNIVSALCKYTSNMHQRWFRSIARLAPSHNRNLTFDNWLFNFLPTIRSHPIQRMLVKKDQDAIIKCAISHLKGPGIRQSLKNALNLGKKIEILLDSTERRVPKEYLSFLNQYNINYYQPKLPQNCLMHSKFILYKSEQESSVTFGSYNWSARSRYLNHEIIASTIDQEIVSSFNKRWKQIAYIN